MFGAAVSRFSIVPHPFTDDFLLIGQSEHFRNHIILSSLHRRCLDGDVSVSLISLSHIIKSADLYRDYKSADFCCEVPVCPYASQVSALNGIFIFSNLHSGPAMQ